MTQCLLLGGGFSSLKKSRSADCHVKSRDLEVGFR